MKRRHLIEIISILFIVLFIYAASSKLLDIQKFRVQLGQSPFLTNYAGLIAWSIPLIEILIAIIFFIPRLRLYALYTSLGLMVLFTTYIVMITRFSDYTPCSCGGVLEKLSWNGHLLFNAVFILAAIWAIYLQQNYNRVKTDSITG